MGAMTPGASARATLRSTIALAAALAVQFLYSETASLAHGGQNLAPQKRRVAVRGNLLGSSKELQVVVIQKTRPRPTAQLAVEVPDTNPRQIWQSEESEEYPVIDSVQVNDLDGDAIPEILSLWKKGPATGARLRVFHWDRAAGSFVEVETEGATGIQSFQISGNAPQKRLVARLAGKQPARNPTAEFKMQSGRIVRLTPGGADVSNGAESGIEGQALISPTRPGPIRPGLPSPSGGYQTTLVVYSEIGGREVARVQTGADGKFRVAVPPGRYAIGPPRDEMRRIPRGSEEPVEVRAGAFAQVTIHFDSGMR
jgi:hypothetical protein